MISVGSNADLGYRMTIVTIDERGRFTIPKEMGIKSSRAIVISAGSFLVTIPLPDAVYSEAEGWLETGKERKELKQLAEHSASEDAVKRAKRRKQL